MRTFLLTAALSAALMLALVGVSHAQLQSFPPAPSGSVSLGGDLGGTGAAPLVTGIDGNPVGSGAALDAVDGLSSTGVVERTGPGAYLALSVPACNTGSAALTWTGSAFGCLTGLAAGVGYGANTFTGEQTLAAAGAASAPSLYLDGAWYTSGGTASTTKPMLLIEPTGTTSAAWSQNGTGLGVNAPSGYSGNLGDFQVNGVSKASLSSGGSWTLVGGVTAGNTSCFTYGSRGKICSGGNNDFSFTDTSNSKISFHIDGNGHQISGVGAAGPAINCGTGCASVSGTDDRAVITTGSSATSVSVNFGAAWTGTEVCTATAEGATPIAISISNKTLSQITLALSSPMSAGVIDLSCAQ